jgi:hypothetical protein
MTLQLYLFPRWAVVQQMAAPDRTAVVDMESAKTALVDGRHLLR